MSELLVNTIKKADGTGSLSVPAESGTVVTTASPSLGRRNLIINGAQNVWQRSTSATLASAGTYITNDRWKYWASGATLASARTAFTLGQTDVSNFQYYNSLTVGANSGVGDYATFNQHVENVILADAQTFTLSFYAKSSQSWTIGIEPIQNFGSGGSARVLHTPVNVTVGTTWERHTVTFTTNSVTGKTLGTGDNFELAFWISGGSNFDARTGGIGNQSGTFDITGVQLEVGSVATPFEHRSYGEELALCQRYYQVLVQGADICIAVGHYYDSGIWHLPVQFMTEMRATPSLDIVSSTNYYQIEKSGGTDGLDDFLFARQSIRGGLLYNNSDVSGGTAGQAFETKTNNAASFIAVKAEL